MTIAPGAFRTLVLMCSITICFSGALAAATAGTVYALGWPLSKPNFLENALVFAVMFGLPGCVATTYMACWVRPSFAVVSLAVGGVLTALVTGVVAFVLNANVAAC